MALLSKRSDNELEPKRSDLVKTLAANSALKVWLILSVILIILGAVAFFAFRSNLKTKLEVQLKDEYEREIATLQSEIEEITAKYEDKLATQKESYEHKLESADDKHKLAIEKKESKIKELEDKIHYLEVVDQISFDEIETEIKSVGKLTTIDYHYTYAGTHEEYKQFFGLDIGITKKSFIAQWDGVVAIGVDLSKLRISVNEQTKIITVSMPEAEIFYHDIDEESFEILDEKNNIFNRITIEDKIKFDIKYEKKIYEKIEQNQMLEDAYENAQVMVENILKGVPQISEQYAIKFQKIS